MKSETHTRRRPAGSEPTASTQPPDTHLPATEPCQPTVISHTPDTRRPAPPLSTPTATRSQNSGTRQRQAGGEPTASAQPPDTHPRATERCRPTVISHPPASASAEQANGNRVPTLRHSPAASRWRANGECTDHGHSPASHHAVPANGERSQARHPTAGAFAERANSNRALNIGHSSAASRWQANGECADPGHAPAGLHAVPANGEQSQARHPPASASAERANGGRPQNSDPHQRLAGCKPLTHAHGTSSTHEGGPRVRSAADVSNKPPPTPSDARSPPTHNLTFHPRFRLDPPNRALVLFAGPCKAKVHLAGALANEGFTIEAVDTLLGGQRHDLTDDHIAGAWVERIENGEFGIVAIATPCSTFSVLNDPPLRTKIDPEAKSTQHEERYRHLSAANKLVEFSARAIAAADAAGAAWLIENPAEVGEQGTTWHWQEKASHASLFDMPAIKAAIGSTISARRTFAMCAFGCGFQKWTQVVCGGRLLKPSQALNSRVCVHAKHDVRLNTVDENGNHRAPLAAEYPPELCEVLAKMAYEARRITSHTAAAGAPEARSPEATPPNRDTSIYDPDDTATEPLSTDGGQIADGPDLSEGLATAVELARASVPRHGSARNLLAEANTNAAHSGAPRRHHNYVGGALRDKNQEAEAAQSAARGAPTTASADTRADPWRGGTPTGSDQHRAALLRPLPPPVPIQEPTRGEEVRPRGPISRAALLPRRLQATRANVARRSGQRDGGLA